MTAVPTDSASNWATRSRLGCWSPAKNLTPSVRDVPTPTLRPSTLTASSPTKNPASLPLEYATAVLRQMRRDSASGDWSRSIKATAHVAGKAGLPGLERVTRMRSATPRAPSSAFVKLATRLFALTEIVVPSAFTLTPVITYCPKSCSR